MGGNILNFNPKNLELRLSDSENYDFYLTNNDGCSSKNISENLVVHFDFNNNDTFAEYGITGNTISSLKYWDKAVNNGYELDTIGFTGIDNGFISFKNDFSDPYNFDLVDTITGTTLIIPENKKNLLLHKVSGSTGNFVYPINYVVSTGSTGNYLDFCGGFYQGFYKIDGTDYEVLPNRTNNGWTMEMWINKHENCSVTGTTLNDLYPNNKGIIFYMGTRAENKFWNQFDGNNSGDTYYCSSGATEWCTIPKERDIILLDDNDLPISLNPPNIIINEITNKFLIYGRARNRRCSDIENNLEGDRLGTKTAPEFTGNSIFITSYETKKTDFRNPFLIYHRGRGNNCSPCGNNGSGHTVCSYSGDSSLVTKLDWKADIDNNALAIIITDSGSIGVRWLTIHEECSGDTKIKTCQINESFSYSGEIINNVWTNISVRYVPDIYYDDCELKTKGPRKGKLMFYINCRLKHVVDNFDEFIAKRLNDHWKKQIGVPFNISLGGGSQGLLESITFDGQDMSDLDLCIQENFAGTFIGSVSQFKFYSDNLNWCELKTSCLTECDRYNTCTGCNNG